MSTSRLAALLTVAIFVGLAWLGWGPSTLGHEGFAMYTDAVLVSFVVVAVLGALVVGRRPARARRLRRTGSGDAVATQPGRLRDDRHGAGGRAPAPT